MKLWDWLNGNSDPSDKEPYVEDPAVNLPATPTQQYLLCACLHFCLSVLLPILFYSVGGRETETSVPGSQEMIASGKYNVTSDIGFVLFHLIQALQWPMSWILGFLSHLAGAPMFTGLLGYIPIALNSLLCAIPIYYAWRWYAGRKGKQPI